MNDVYPNIDEYNPNKEHKKKIVLDDLISEMLNK